MSCSDWGELMGWVEVNPSALIGAKLFTNGKLSNKGTGV